MRAALIRLATLHAGGRAVLEPAAAVDIRGECVTNPRAMAAKPFVASVRSIKRKRGIG
jgi:hypothetical protein